MYKQHTNNNQFGKAADPTQHQHVNPNLHKKPVFSKKPIFVHMPQNKKNNERVRPCYSPVKRESRSTYGETVKRRLVERKTVRRPCKATIKNKNIEQDLPWSPNFNLCDGAEIRREDTILPDSLENKNDGVFQENFVDEITNYLNMRKQANEMIDYNQKETDRLMKEWKLVMEKKIQVEKQVEDILKKNNMIREQLKRAQQLKENRNKYVSSKNGYKFEEFYEIGEEIGSGGQGKVYTGAFVC